MKLLRMTYVLLMNISRCHDGDVTLRKRDAVAALID